MSTQIKTSYTKNGFQWLRGNLHAHTTISDGKLTPEEVIAGYEGLGYDFLALSDHDKLVSTELYQPTTKMTLIPADEVSNGGQHILAVKIDAVIDPDPNRQKVIDEINGQGGFAVMNHPNWLHDYAHASLEVLKRLTGYMGIEIYNGVVERLPGNAQATDRWDQLLSAGRHVWGFAHDDFHDRMDFGRGWNVVQSQDRSLSAIYEALVLGRFYASTGVKITEIYAEDDRIFVTAPKAQRIRFIGPWSQEFAFVNGKEASFQVTGEEGYVRVECYGECMTAAWSQPFFLGEA